jgi:predicted lipoprotein with Yx(FWY)xxD motif
MRSLLTSVALLAVVLALAGCGGSKKSNSAQSGGTASVNLTGSKLGKILVDAKGRTLYLFEADKNGKSACTGSCAGTWPPFTAASPSAGNGLDDGALATTTRADGTQQVTYHGHPLYYYAGDGKAAGSTKGEDLNTFGGAWYVVDGAGKAVEPSGSGGDMSGGGGGYGY